MQEEKDNKVAKKYDFHLFKHDFLIICYLGQFDICITFDNLYNYLKCIMTINFHIRKKG